MEFWRKAWRDGLCPTLSDAALGSLRAALEADDARLIQGGTTAPEGFDEFLGGPVEAACALGFCGWQAYGLTTVGEIYDFFAQVMYAADERLGVAGAASSFVFWFDAAPRDAMRRQLLAEIDLALAERRVTERVDAMACV